MRWCLLDGGSRASSAAIQVGLEAIGEDSFFLDGDVWHDSYFEPCDVMVVFGYRDAQVEAIASCQRRGVPTIVVDLGYTRRLSPENIQPWATVQLSVGRGLNMIPEFRCPPDRRSLYGLDYPGPASAHPAGYALVCGQWPRDPTHPFRDEAAILKWIDAEVKPRAGAMEVRYRPHPRLRHAGIPIETDIDGAAVVVVWSSNSAHDALIAGRPVVRWHDAAVYRPVTSFGPDLVTFDNAFWPDAATWNAYFDRLAYGQWSFEEIRTGRPLKFIADWLAGITPEIPEPPAVSEPVPVETESEPIRRKPKPYSYKPGYRRARVDG